MLCVWFRTLLNVFNPSQQKLVIFRQFVYRKQCWASSCVVCMCEGARERGQILINPSSGTQCTIKPAEPSFSGDDPGATWVLGFIDLRNKSQLVFFGLHRSESETDVGRWRRVKRSGTKMEGVASHFPKWIQGERWAKKTIPTNIVFCNHKAKASIESQFTC